MWCFTTIWVKTKGINLWSLWNITDSVNWLNYSVDIFLIKGYLGLLTYILKKYNGHIHGTFQVKQKHVSNCGLYWSSSLWEKVNRKSLTVSGWGDSRVLISVTDASNDGYCTYFWLDVLTAVIEIFLGEMV